MFLSFFMSGGSDEFDENFIDFLCLSIDRQTPTDEMLGPTKKKRMSTSEFARLRIVAWNRNVHGSQVRQ